MAAESWLRTQIVEGLQWLYTLQLRNSPPTDIFPVTCRAWIDIVSDWPVAWNQELDTPRVAAAFKTLAQTCDQWPAPVALQRVMPARAEALRITHRPPPPSRARLAALRDAMQRLTTRLTTPPVERRRADGADDGTWPLS